MDGWPDAIDGPIEDYLQQAGRVVRHFGQRRDSRSLVLGVEVDGARYVVKHAADPEAVGWLESALRFHAVVRHPVIAGVVHHLRTPGGLALVEEWATGEVLHDPFDPAVPPRDHPGSPWARFRGMAPAAITAAITDILDAHVAVAAAGFVAVDLYEGCVVYDFDRGRTALIDLDNYCPGPYVLERDRQFGSSAFMAPEEWLRGATIDERTTVYTLGRIALVLLGCPRDGDPSAATFRGSDRQYAVATAAATVAPADRIPTVAELAAAWAAAGDET